MPPSAAFGLVLNLAGIEMRENTDAVTTTIRKDLPCLELAIGSVAGTKGEISTLYQQLHSYPVGNSGKDTLKPLAKGAKFWIVPVRRELLVGLDMVLGIKGDRSLLDRVLQGLKGEFNSSRYGLPFAGDNNFLFDRIDVISEPLPSFWYVQMQSENPPMRNSYRLTVGIDRSDNSKTSSYLYAPIEVPCDFPPDESWTWTPKQPVLN
jgi:CRISPR-associated protein Cas5t